MDLGSLWAGRNYPHASALFQRASDLMQALGKPQHYILSRNRLAYRLITSGQPVTAITMLEGTIKAAHQQGDLHGEAQALELLASATLFYGDMQRAVSSYDRAYAF